MTILLFKKTDASFEVEGRWPGFCILKSRGNAAATGPWTTLSKGLDIPDSIQPAFVKTAFNAVINFQRGSRECVNFKTDLLVLLLNCLSDAVEGYMIFQKGPRCLSINKSPG